jgi:hypothetical protein
LVTPVTVVRPTKNVNGKRAKRRAAQAALVAKASELLKKKLLKAQSKKTDAKTDK